MKATKLTDNEIAAALADLPRWEQTGNKLQRTYKFKNFVAALGWMVQAGMEAEKMDHHPNWSNVWNTVEVTLWTHEKDAITNLDIQLATKMEELAG
jgi:4a-hydroxytetrahydrobiopterin dehydratase